MPVRIYVDESETHGQKWLVIGMLFVPDHGALHSALCEVKEENEYYNRSPKRNARYKEVHFADINSFRDVTVSKQWIDEFIRHTCYYRCVVVDWSIWDGSYFGDPFEPDALVKRRAYKKWAEMLLHPELKSPTIDGAFTWPGCTLIGSESCTATTLLRHLEEQLKGNYEGHSPYIDVFQHTDSWKDANQCLQLCDLLTGGMYRALDPPKKKGKNEVRTYLERQLRVFGVQQQTPGFWRQFEGKTLRQHFPKFCDWFWRPTSKGAKRKRRRNQ